MIRSYRLSISINYPFQNLSRRRKEGEEEKKRKKKKAETRSNVVGIDETFIYNVHYINF